VEDLGAGAIRQAIRERVRRERIGCLQLNKGWFCFLKEGRGYANYRGWIGLPGDGKTPPELRKTKTTEVAEVNSVVRVKEVRAEESTNDETMHAELHYKAERESEGSGVAGLEAMEGDKDQQTAEDCKAGLKREGDGVTDGLQKGKRKED
jgi:hypothetical protein